MIYKYHIRRSVHKKDFGFITIYKSETRLFSFHTHLLFFENIKNIFDNLKDKIFEFKQIFYITIPIFTFKMRSGEYPNITTHHGNITKDTYVFKTLPLYFNINSNSDAKHFYNHLNYFFKCDIDDVYIKCKFNDSDLYTNVIKKITMVD